MRRRLDREDFEKIYAQSPDPWSYETSSYEHSKYERTLEVLAHRRYNHALEAGCSIGVFTAMLAPLCDKLLAVDISEKAVFVARERLAIFPQVCVEQRVLPEEMPEGPFDLIVASELLGYWPKETTLAALRRFEEVLIPGGTLLAVHGRVPWTSWRRGMIEKVRPLFLRHWILRNRPFFAGGDEVHEWLIEHTLLTTTASFVEPLYRIELFEKK
jgi:SAM-dependent methyltransferase